MSYITKWFKERSERVKQKRITKVKEFREWFKPYAYDLIKHDDSLRFTGQEGSISIYYNAGGITSMRCNGISLIKDFEVSSFKWMAIHILLMQSKIEIRKLHMELR